MLVEVVEESETDRLLARFFVSCLFKNLAEAVHPATELLCRVQNVLGKLVELSLDLVSCRVVRHFRIVVLGSHTNQRLAAPESFVSCHGSDCHFCDCVENPSLPVVIVLAHFFAVLGVFLERALFDALQVDVADVLIVFDKLCDRLLTVLVEVLGELVDGHDLLVCEVDGANDLSHLDVLDLLLDVVGMLKNASFRFFK